MTHTYTPRRCSSRWLDGDCPDGVLAIIDHGEKMPSERFDVFYCDVETHWQGAPAGGWLTYFCIGENGAGYHGEMATYEVAAYRYRMKHRYARWSTLPGAVKRAVRADLAPVPMPDHLRELHS